MLKVGLATIMVAFCLLTSLSTSAADNRALATVAVRGSGPSDTAIRISFDGVVEACRETVLSTQVPGAIVALHVKTGDVAGAGQELLRIDSRVARQVAAASLAQVRAAQALLNVAAGEYGRQQQLFQKQYISQAALDRAKGQFQAARAQVQALQAQAGATHTQSSLFVITAPYAGVISSVPIALGDMAVPGRPLLTLYDPSALRVTVAVPQTALAGLDDAAGIQLEFPGIAAAASWIQATRTQVLPVVDAATHTVQVRLDLPVSFKGVAPGMFARVWLPETGAKASAGERLYVPSSAIVQRVEMTGVYVVDSRGKPLLRQVRLGPRQGNLVEVLSGVQKGEQVALDPQAAVRVH